MISWPLLLKLFGPEHTSPITVNYKHFLSLCFVHEAQLPENGMWTQDHCGWRTGRGVPCTVSSFYFFLGPLWAATGIWKGVKNTHKVRCCLFGIHWAGPYPRARASSFRAERQLVSCTCWCFLSISSSSPSTFVCFSFTFSSSSSLAWSSSSWRVTCRSGFTYVHDIGHWLSHPAPPRPWASLGPVRATPGGAGRPPWWRRATTASAAASGTRRSCAGAPSGRSAAAASWRRPWRRGRNTR